MADRELPEPSARWLLLRIPLGTVWAEEAAFRAALGTVARSAFGPRWAGCCSRRRSGCRMSPTRADRRARGGTVLVTGAAGWLFGLLYERSGSLAAPMLAHLAINEAGAVAALAVQRPARR